MSPTTPLTHGAVPMTAAPSLNVTVPLGRPVAAVTVVDNVTAWYGAPDTGETDRTVVVGRAGVGVTTTETGPDVDAALLPPRYVAVIALVPTGMAEVVSAAAPPERAA